MQPNTRPRSAPNRLLDLRELETPRFRRILAELDALEAREPVSYLHPGKRWEYPWALEGFELDRPQRVADVGCGDSIFPIFLASHGQRVTAVDLAFTAGLADAHGVRVGYVAGDMTALPLSDEAFDHVFCISVIEHLPPDRVDVAMRELRRVLRPGGTLSLTTDYYRDADAEIWHESPERRFRVDWRIFDERRLRRHILDAPGFEIAGPNPSLAVDWDDVEPRMRRFHGYPYTSVGVKLVRRWHRSHRNPMDSR